MPSAQKLFACLLSRSRAPSSGLHPSYPGDLWNSRLWTPLFTKAHKIHPLSLWSECLWGNVLVSSPECASFSPFFVTRVLCTLQHLQSVSLPNHVSALLTFLRVASCLSLLVGVCFCQFSGHFRGYSEWFDGYLAVFEGQSKPRVLLPHLLRLSSAGVGLFFFSFLFCLSEVP